ncbi:MAG: hypothetical protein A3F54_02420 [Candidatus Kerfeldbacteria bacterium RIFCSPHIGHO2_12_FULL_48_17]|uniref:Membrane insertase YidC/Oxa/ALB C-terminal domain-containing protein n=1 Tax=Candidatus Kerfeldbacteria bacterium RIFCSPHIGHO2_12_FULL_48_17 TaxID=1798542 RepID=A0A1G2B927_9BACT|nr:MAG: hypothetical protein A3F54_02420 [Candidatus Kerfeldbacteria bacterium RIFCSPHIGHO2_12_FULL_48_17]
MIEIFNTVLYEPLFNALIWLFQVTSDFGIAILLLTLAIKLLLFWPSMSSIKAQKQLQETQPKLDALRKKYANNKEELGKEMIKFYKENKVNPLSSCLPLLIQLPILIALYQVFFNGLHTDPATGFLVAEQLQHLYGPLRDMYSHTAIETHFLGLFDLAKTGNYVIAILAALFQFLSSRLSLRRQVAPVKTPGAADENMTAAINKQMMYFLPIITVIFGVRFPAGVTFYWLISTVFTLAQQMYVFRRFKKDDSKAIIDIKE